MALTLTKRRRQSVARKLRGRGAVPRRCTSSCARQQGRIWLLLRARGIRLRPGGGRRDDDGYWKARASSGLTRVLGTQLTIVNRGPEVAYVDPLSRAMAYANHSNNLPFVITNTSDRIDRAHSRLPCNSVTSVSYM